MFGILLFIILMLFEFRCSATYIPTHTEYIYTGWAKKTAYNLKIHKNQVNIRKKKTVCKVKIVRSSVFFFKIGKKIISKTTDKWR